MFRTVAVAVAAVAGWCMSVAALAQQTTDAEPYAWRPVTEFSRPALMLDMGSHTRLVLQPPERRPWGDAPGLAPKPTRAGLGIEFKGRPRDGVPAKLLRVQMSSDSSLQFRPRGGGLAVAYRAQF